MTVTIPTQNIDASTAGGRQPHRHLRRDQFDKPPPRPAIFEIASKVASIDVQPAPRRDRNRQPVGPSTVGTAATGRNRHGSQLDDGGRAHPERIAGGADRHPRSSGDSHGRCRFHIAITSPSR
jgi:hypothetical protein